MNKEKIELISLLGLILFFCYCWFLKRIKVVDKAIIVLTRISIYACWVVVGILIVCDIVQ